MSPHGDARGLGVPATFRGGGSAVRGYPQHPGAGGAQFGGTHSISAREERSLGVRERSLGVPSASRGTGSAGLGVPAASWSRGSAVWGYPQHPGAEGVQFGGTCSISGHGERSLGVSPRPLGDRESGRAPLFPREGIRDPRSASRLGAPGWSGAASPARGVSAGLGDSEGDSETREVFRFFFFPAEEAKREL